MILTKNDLQPFVGFGSIYGNGSYILSATKDGQFDFTTSRQRITKVKENGPNSRKNGATNTNNHGIIELDTHSDTIVFGQSFILLSDTGQ